MAMLIEIAALDTDPVANLSLRDAPPKKSKMCGVGVECVVRFMGANATRLTLASCRFTTSRRWDSWTSIARRNMDEMLSLEIIKFVGMRRLLHVKIVVAVD